MQQLESAVTPALRGPATVGPSLLRLGAAQRLALAGLVLAALWLALGLALGPAFGPTIELGVLGELDELVADATPAGR